MAGVCQTEFLLPPASCAPFLADLTRSGIRFTEPFELREAECLAVINTPEMASAEFWLSFWELPSGATSRCVHFHWHALRGADGPAIARNVAAKVQAIAVQHGAIISWGAVGD